MTKRAVRGGFARAARWMAVSWMVYTVALMFDLAPSLLGGRRDGGARGGPPPGAVEQRTLAHVAMWYSLWLLTPLMFWLANRYRFEAGTRVRSALMHVAGALLVSSVVAAAMSGATTIVAGPAQEGFWFVSPLGIVQYAGICVVATMLDYRAREREHAVAAARLESELAQARLGALTGQLRPHFLYNALNGVAMLIREGSNAAALESVLGYSELLRHVLNAGTPDVPLGEEMDFVERYLAIERMRFPDRLTSVVTMGDGLADALVPTLILQPLVENSLHHGLADVERDARIEIVAEARRGALRLEVRDNGVGLPPHWRLGEASGVGLRNTQMRLRQRYGDAHHFELHSPAEGGTTVILEIPLQFSRAVVHSG